jgi:hypothetical protein
MKRFLFGATALGLALLMPTWVEAQKKDKKPDDEEVSKATPQDYGQLNQMKEIVGKLTFAEGNVKSLVLRVQYPTYEPNPNFKKANTGGGGGNNNQGNLAQSYQKLMYDQQKAMNIPNPLQRQQALDKIARDRQQLMMKMYQQPGNTAGFNPGGKNAGNQANMPYLVVNNSKDFELEVQDSVVTRRVYLPTDYDDKGNLKQYSKAELAELKGKDSSKPGFAAKYDDLAVGQQVKLFLVPSAAKKKVEGEDVPTVKPSVRMVLILQDAPMPGLTAPAKGDKKK